MDQSVRVVLKICALIIRVCFLHMCVLWSILPIHLLRGNTCDVYMFVHIPIVESLFPELYVAPLAYHQLAL